MRTAEYLRGLAKRVREDRIIVEQEIATDGDVTLEACDVELCRLDGLYHVAATYKHSFEGRFGGRERCNEYKRISTPVLAEAIEELDDWAETEIDL